MFFLLLGVLVAGLCFLRETELVFVSLYSILMIVGLVYGCALADINIEEIIFYCGIMGAVMGVVVYGVYRHTRKRQKSLDLPVWTDQKKDLFFRVLIPLTVVVAVPDMSLAGIKDKAMPLALALVLLGVWRCVNSGKVAGFMLYGCIAAYGLLILSLPMQVETTAATLALVVILGMYHYLWLMGDKNHRDI